MGFFKKINIDLVNKVAVSGRINNWSAEQKENFRQDYRIARIF